MRYKVFQSFPYKRNFSLLSFQQISCLLLFNTVVIIPVYGLHGLHNEFQNNISIIKENKENLPPGAVGKSAQILKESGAVFLLDTFRASLSDLRDKERERVCV